MPGAAQDDFIYVAMNTHWDSHWFGPPQLPEGMWWHMFANTGVASPEDAWTPGQEPRLEDQSGLTVGERSVVIMVGR
jgi:glycogen operon protein